MASTHLADREKGEFFVTNEVRRDYEENGYVIVRRLLIPEELVKLRSCIEESEDIRKHTIGRDDGFGRISRLALWNYAGDDVCGVVARSQKIAGTMQNLMGGDEIYHYHSKAIMKEANTGGSHVWHQDYGYWYQYGCMLPEMGSIFMSIDRCVQANGCLQVLKGSHKMGRINHHLSGDQAGADLERVEQAKQMFPLVHVEMEPGDVLFFHCNLLHTSAQNHSDLRRYAMITSVNKRKNNPVIEHHHPQYHPLDILPNSTILECDLFNSKIEKWFMGGADDVGAHSREDHENNNK